MDYIVHGVTKSWTWLNDFHFTSEIGIMEGWFNQSWKPFLALDHNWFILVSIVTLKLKAEYTSRNLQWSKSCTFYIAYHERCISVKSWLLYRNRNSPGMLLKWILLEVIRFEENQTLVHCVTTYSYVSKENVTYVLFLPFSHWHFLSCIALTIYPPIPGKLPFSWCNDINFY